ncbi:MAG: hypothetical protein B7Z36_05395 [Novosphingobium sp. 12-63-9]|nr:MAG: hypothetical protein B7Z36_05395 [Novosphingobium sp. 12-63-9]
MVDEVKDNTETPVETAPAPVVEAVAAAPEPVVAPEASPAVVETPKEEAAQAAELLPVKRKPGRPRKDVEPKLDALAPVVAPSKPLVTKKVAAPAAPVASKALKPAVAAPKAIPVKAKPVVAPRTGKVAAKKPIVAATVPASVPVKSIPVIPAAAPVLRSAPAPWKEAFIMNTTTDISGKIQSAMKDAADKAKVALEKSQASFGEMGEFTKGNVEAVVESSKIFASGLQEMGKSYAEEGKSVMESMSADLKDLVAVKSPAEFFEKQTALLRKRFDSMVAVSSKNSEAALKLANEAFQPISNRVSLAVEKMKQAA